MIIVPVKEGENIEKALKKFKRKFEKTKSNFFYSRQILDFSIISLIFVA